LIKTSATDAAVTTSQFDGSRSIPLSLARVYDSSNLWLYFGLRHKPGSPSCEYVRQLADPASRSAKEGCLTGEEAEGEFHTYGIEEGSNQTPVLIELRRHLEAMKPGWVVYLVLVIGG
jgi:hypothetical protein